MADNLSVSVTADTSELRAQLALAQADLKAFGAETRNLANSIRSGGDAGGVLRGQLEQVVGAAANAKSNVVSLTGALRDHTAAHQEAAAGIKGVTGALEGMISPIGAAVGGFGKMAEILGVAFAAEKIIDFAKEMGELGERTLNMAAAVGTTPEKFSLLSVALGLAGGNAETASRTLERLGKNISAALSTPTSQAANAFRALGVTEQQLQKASTDLEYGLRLLAEKFVEFQDTPSKTAAYMAILGRGMEQLVPIFRQGGAGLDEFTAKARETGAVLDGETARAMADTGEKIHVLAATLEGTGVQAFGLFKSSIDAVISTLTAFVKGVGDAFAAVKNFNALPPPTNEGFYSQTGKWRTFHPNPNAPAPRGGHYEDAAGPHGSHTRRWVQDEQRPEDIGSGTWGGDVYGAGPSNIGDLTGFPSKPVVPSIEKPEKPAKGGGGRGRAAKDTSDADAKAAEQAALERIGNEEKVDDLILDRRTKLIEATKAAGKISLDQEYALLVDNLARKQTADQNYYQQKIAAAAGDAKEQQKLQDQEALSYQDYLTKRQELDIKYFEARKAAETKAAADSKAAWDKVLQPLTSSFDAAIKGFIQGTTTLQQGLQRAFQGVLLDPLIKNVEGGLKTALMSTFSGTDIANSFIGKFFSGTLFGGASKALTGAEFGTTVTTAGTTFASVVQAAGTAFAASVSGAGATGGAGNLAGGGGLFSALGGLFGGGATAGIGGAATLSSGTSALDALAPALLAFRRGGIVPSAQGGWAVPSMGSGGVLAQLHSQEMVLPANVSQMFQSMAAGRGGAAPNLTYAPQIGGKGPFDSRAQLEAVLRNHGNEMIGHAANMVRNGWRPGAHSYR